MGRQRYLVSLIGVIAITQPERASASEEPETRQMTQEEIEAWLDASAVDSTRDVGTVEAYPDAPPPPPRKHGLVVEGSLDGVGHLGPLKNVSPTSPEFRFAIGYEVFDPLLIFADGGMFLSSTRYAKPPPNERTYAYYSFGGGLRYTFEFLETFAVYLQGNAGLATSTEDVLVIYGYRESDELSLYFGGQLGFEWLQKNPHYALAAHGGVKNYTGLDRERSSDPPLVVNAGVAIKYTF